MKPVVHPFYFGKTDYLQSMDLQNQWVRRIQQDGTQIALLGFEYDPVITLGRRASLKEDVKKTGETTPIHVVSRGGQATFHSPGQLVVYPICNIRFLSQRPKFWVQFLLQKTLSSLQKLSPHEQSLSIKEGQGIFRGEEKLVSLGLRIEKGVSSFGLALNLKNDVHLFSQIRPCGREGQAMGRLHYEGSLNEAFLVWCNEFVCGLEGEIFL